ncbi:chemotaxis protein CheW [bacterium (Candidatus Blackallbacteria) CG17_big_fil_post_rev_8_21_14_2_50_48_46]|uniref:Chemotaxis protein CheW n=1 Tax=bacterium (Candidatus Blackallbacteria) CG17_big_fil_post_rev_8_21_14_2_50_48_46 TaxID=2014261 RepID=A0A2M7G3M1_9BACT|nr:MAG: chemotaxis protein CheW [bacterium (Candidatus Blackallbacteria) CG18_big_fil_WC_8_21_14_2_50_49_26]PIW16427.1 MAG: chemotaxis protein CheW [bacterium (Candidatus Blackallbacteria) CG17_big_fil_post_rev_8_21_14_2_50_48_46]PIW45935.1 MAG: chemotaxis protein CheW [bacterium (Candidatus Blackallbacteria) CG13_big_fil_rev_8_21_14_2_50_49_14]
MPAASAQELYIVVFRLGTEEYSIPVSHVQEIQRCHRLSLPRQMPDIPEYFEGIIDLRGQIIPILDLRKRFHLNPQEPGRESCYIIVETHHDMVGFLVDAVSEVLRVSADLFTPPPARLRTAVSARYMVGVGKLKNKDENARRERLVVLLDIDKILNEDETNPQTSQGEALAG